MKYYIIANNTQLTEESIDKIDLDGNNVLVLFNYLWPLRFKSIIEYTNKICISRQTIPGERKEKYANIAGIRISQDLFKTIYFHVHPSQMSVHHGLSYQKEIDNYSFESSKLGVLDSDCINIRKDIGYPLGKSISTGLFILEYLSRTKSPEDQIIIVGFTSNISNKHHNSQWEKLYILNQINLNKYSFIQSYGLNERL